jgi:hypothetical protein
VLATRHVIASSSAVAPLAPGAVLGVLSSGGDPTLPDAARTIVRERRVRALAYGGAAEDMTISVAATCAADGESRSASDRPRNPPVS